ncbi:hypothetical protein E8E12_010542 [Didymella heteroderae]|uniref:Uncharacterized protein n=1 Tax=Didymella heteroderae TaxID=1769908 RepID=A0A9P4WX24_9PLEO|nr:hypothetical protein E8E12_010542 [Didymella heteroderae]
MFFILALRAAIAVVDTCAPMKNALTAAGNSCPKVRPELEDTKHSIKSSKCATGRPAHNAPSAAVAIKSHRAAFYAQFERIVCAGLVRQHAALHLNIPEDLLEGFCVDVRMLDKFKLFTLGFEQMQMERWAYKWDSHGLMKWFEKHPEKKEQSIEWRQDAEQSRENCPEDFENYFHGSLDFNETAAEAIAAESEPSRPPSPSSELFLPSPVLSFSSSPFESGPKVVSCDRHSSNDSGYSSGLDFDIDADGVTKDDAVVHAAISRHRRWSDCPGVNDFLAHESCTFIVDYAANKMAKVY